MQQGPKEITSTKIALTEVQNLLNEYIIQNKEDPSSYAKQAEQGLNELNEFYLAHKQLNKEGKGAKLSIEDLRKKILHDIAPRFCTYIRNSQLRLDLEKLARAWPTQENMLAAKAKELKSQLADLTNQFEQLKVQNTAITGKLKDQRKLEKSDKKEITHLHSATKAAQRKQQNQYRATHGGKSRPSMTKTATLKQPGL